MTEFEHIIVTPEQQWLEITLDRAASFNALSQQMMSELQLALDQASLTDDFTCIIIKAQGKAFCAGHDLKQMRVNNNADYYQNLFDQCSQLMQTIVQCPMPVIAQVQGVATAAGCQLVATCDLAVASQNARFAVSGINIGLFCSTPAVALSRNIHPKKAMEMLLTGEFISATEAQQQGLVNRVVAAEDLTQASRDLAAIISSKAKVAVRTGKAMFYPQLNMDLPQAYQFAAEHMVCNLMTPETQHGLDAFVNKKPKG